MNLTATLTALRTIRFDCQSYLIENVTDDQLTASSNYGPRYTAIEARLSNTRGWSPNTGQSDPWIQVDFERVVRLKGVVTKGLGETSLLEWVKKYQVKYSDTASTWTTVIHGASNEFTANSDPSTPVTNVFPVEVSARYLRLYPTDCNQYCSLRFDAIGCEVTPTTTFPPETTSTTNVQITSSTHAPMTTTTPSTLHPETTSTTNEQITNSSTHALMTTTTSNTLPPETTSTTNEQITNSSTHAPMTTTTSNTLPPETTSTTNEQITSSTHAPITTTTSTSSSSTRLHTSSHASTTHVVTSTQQQTTSTISSSSGQAMGALCPCPCPQAKNFTMTQAELEVWLLNISRNLVIPKETISSFIRTKISVQDSRPEMVCVGSLGIILLCFIVSCIVLPDLCTFLRFLYNLLVSKTNMNCFRSIYKT
ncbi:uncharacterized protein LOC130054498 [Ostrea edulis]|uniref:uncharacterized protein LOC130054498 n=1 Tax=Ostrea edulis TaxID=37623 RepID=UPI0024AEBDF8|nr:uncharacterized protein LOC130054498 [Ostrea edulis]